MFKKLWERSQNNPIVFILIALLIGISIITLAFYIPDTHEKEFLVVHLKVVDKKVMV